MTFSLLPVLYLNLLEHEGKTFIKCWHKPHSLIHQKLKAAPWISYSQTYKCYVMHHTPQAIAQTQQYFSGIAAVSTRYLYRPKRLQPTEGTTILAHRQLPVLQKRAEPSIMHLAPLLVENIPVISITFKYNPLLNSRLRGLLFVKWQPSANCFTIPTDSKSLPAL